MVVYDESQVIELFKKLGSRKFRYVGKNGIMVQCPFGEKHSDGVDAHPSCRILLSRGIYYCFACKSSGSLDELFKNEINKIIKPSLKEVFAEALVRLELKELDEDILCEFDFDNFEYAVKRGISVDICRLFEIGFDAVNGRSIFVVRDRFGKFVGIQGRSVDTSEKHPYYDYFTNNSIRDHLYRADLFRGVGSAILVEGVFDVLNMYQHGYTNVLGVFGSSVTRNQIAVLKGLGIRLVYVLFDSDDAGDMGYIKFKRKWYGKAIRVKPDKDPSELTKEEIDQLFEEFDFARV